MKEIQVQFAARFIERQWSTAIGKSLLKTLTEPITNSDDSYRRLSESDKTKTPSPVPIVIHIDRKRRFLRIVDNAQGMSFKDLEKKFEEYGAAKSGAYEGFSARGLFGQGISDVLFYHKDGKIRSIKNGEASVCSFYKKHGKPYISVEQTSVSAKQAAKDWDINCDHGTSVEFTVDDDTPIHDLENLVKRLGVFYMLRLINSNDNRKVEIVYKDTKGTKTAQIKYQFPKGDLVDHKEFSFDMDGYNPIKVDVELYRSATPLATSDEERESGLLVFDDKQAIYDQTFFGLENLRGADKYFGTMKLTGAREIILDKMNDPKHPEAILTDSRDGFDKQNIFYKKLSAKVKDWLYPILNEEGRRRNDEGISENTKDKHRKALDELNKLYAELAGEDSSGTIHRKEKGRPVGGIEFARNSISVTAGKQYGLQLIIDTKIIPVGSRILLSTKKWKVSHSPKYVTVSEAPAGKEGIFVKTILIKGGKPGDVDTLEANWEKHRAGVVISVVAESIVYPENGMVFSPDYVRIANGKKGLLHLFVDASLFKQKSFVRLTSSNSTIKLGNESFEVSKPKQGTIISFEVPFHGENDSQSGIIEAICEEYACQCRVDIKDPSSTPPSSHSGKFRDWTFDDALPRSRQTTYDDIPGSATQGFILVSSTHPINRKYFGDSPSKVSVESTHIAQLYLAELILNESLGAIVAEVYQKGFIPNNYGPAIDIPVYIAQKKFELGPRIYDYFVEADPGIREVKRSERLEAAKLTQTTSAKEILESLEDRARQMVEMYFGLNDQWPHTLEEIALKFGVTRERIRQIINKSLAPKRTEISGLTGETVVVDSTDYILERRKEIDSTINQVIDLTAQSFGLSGIEALKEKTRRADVAVPRQVAMYVLRTKIGLSFPSIGRLFGLDHTTVMHGCNKIEELQKKDGALTKRIENIQKHSKEFGQLTLVQ
jgi:hypothetical protein